MSWEWTLIQVECTGCGICADICPERAILQSRDMPTLSLSRENAQAAWNVQNSARLMP